MEQRKLNISLWCMLGIAVVLMVGLLIGSVGTSFARYRAEREETIAFQARAMESIYLGRMEYPEEDSVDGETDETVETTEQEKEPVFVADAQNYWVTVDDQTTLDFAVSNGISEEEFAQEDMQVHIRLIGSLGIWDGEDTVELTLLVPNEDDPEKMDEITAEAVRIGPESPLYTAFGDGWVFSFPDEDGEELALVLEGGKQSVIELKLEMENTNFSLTSLLQLQVTGTFVQD